MLRLQERMQIQRFQADDPLLLAWSEGVIVRKMFLKSWYVRPNDSLRQLSPKYTHNWGKIIIMVVVQYVLSLIISSTNNHKPKI